MFVNWAVLYPARRFRNNNVYVKVVFKTPSAHIASSFYGGSKLETEFTPNLMFPSNAASPLESIVLFYHFLDFLFVFAERVNLVFHSWQTK